MKLLIISVFIEVKEQVKLNLLSNADLRIYKLYFSAFSV